MLHGSEKKGQDERREMEVDEEELVVEAEDVVPPAEDEAWKRNTRLLLYSFAVSGVYVSSSHSIQSPNTDIVLDTPFLLPPPNPRHTLPRTRGRLKLALDPQPLPSLYRPRHHHGSRNYRTHASRGHNWLGDPLSSCKTSWLGPRSSTRLHYRQQRLANMGQPCNHACRQPHLPRLDLLRILHPFHPFPPIFLLRAGY